ncbi:MAG TPA: A24 family peptidase [Pseudomonadales bacterium]
MLSAAGQVFAFQLGLVLVLGLSIGSFLNVVIYRLPIMLERSWRREALAFLAREDEQSGAAEETFNLAVPGSACPHCNTAIRPWQNIPVLSFLLLGGRCAGCSAKISWRYPVVELLTGFVSVLLFLQFGWNGQLLAMLLFSYVCIALIGIDYDHQLLPDSLTLPLLWAGLILNSQALFVPLEHALWGAVGGYLFLWTVFWLFRIVTGKEGMGYGDFKLMAAFGAWFGWAALPNIVLLSSLTGAVLGGLLIVCKLQDAQKPIPFGPFIAIAGWLTAVYPDFFMIFAYL